MFACWRASAKRLGRWWPAPLCHAAGRRCDSGRTAGHVDNGISRVPRQTSPARAEQGVGTNPRFFSVPIGSSHTIRPSPTPSRHNRRKHNGNRPRRHADLPCFIARASGAKGTRGQGNGARGKSARQHARKETGRMKGPCPCESKRIVLASRPRADYARVMWTSRRRFACLREEGRQPFGGKRKAHCLLNSFKMACSAAALPLSLGAGTSLVRVGGCKPVVRHGKPRFQVNRPSVGHSRHR